MWFVTCRWRFNCLSMASMNNPPNAPDPCGHHVPFDKNAVWWSSFYSEWLLSTVALWVKQCLAAEWFFPWFSPWPNGLSIPVKRGCTISGPKKERQLMRDRHHSSTNLNHRWHLCHVSPPSYNINFLHKTRVHGLKFHMTKSLNIFQVATFHDILPYLTTCYSLLKKQSIKPIQSQKKVSTPRYL